MSDDWQAGDLALCIRVGGWYRVAVGLPYGAHDWMPKAGRIYRVEQVVIQSIGTLGLVLEGVKRPGFSKGATWTASAFRKIRPEDMTDEDREVIELMKTRDKETVE